MTTNGSVEKIANTHQDRVRGVQLVRDGLAAAYGDIAKANVVANPDDPEDLRQQGDWYRSEVGERLGYYLDDEMVGLMMIGEWYRGDQAPFASPLGRMGIRTLKLMGTPSLPTRPLGIHTLEVDRTLSSPAQNEVLSMLAVHAVNAAGPREIRISLPDGDPAEAVMRTFGFQATGRYGIRPGVPDLPQQLYRRQRLSFPLF